MIHRPLPTEDEDAELSEEAMLKALARWHPAGSEHCPLELISLEVRAVREVVMGRVKHNQWEGLRRRSALAADHCLPLLEQADTLLRRLHGALETAEQACSREMSRIEQQRNERQAQVQTLLETHLQKLAQEIKSLENDEEMESVLQVCAEGEERLRGERRQQQEVLLACELEQEELRCAFNRRVKEATRGHEVRMAALRDALKQAEKDYLFQIRQLRERREAFERRILQHIETQIAQRHPFSQQ